MNYQPIPKQPLINVPAFIRALSMWVILWGGTVGLATYQGQPGIICLTPMAWLLAIPAGLNYVAFSEGKPGRNPFLAGALVGATLGLLLGLICWGFGTYTMPDVPGEEALLGVQEISLIMIGVGTVIDALLGGLMAHRAAAQQRRGRTIAAVTVQ